MMRLLSVLLLSLGLAACSTVKKDRPEPPTIASIENNPVDIEQDTTLDATRNQAISSYRKFLNSAEQNRYHAEAMRRVADLELEELEDRVARYSGTDNERATRAADYDKVVELYSSMLRNHPNYANNDGVLYQLAKVHEQSGEIERALEVFDRLIKQFPQSKYATEVQFRRGEILFVLRRYKDANSAYQAVLNAGKGTPFYQRALYKHGWSEFKRSRFENALHSFFALLDIKFSDPDSGQLTAEVVTLSRGEKELLQDTFRVISLSFSYLDGARSIKEYFERYQHRPYEYRVYRRLGDLYMKQERIRDAADTYNTFVRSQPNHAAAPDFQTRVIDAYKKGGFLQLTLKAKEEFAQRYNKQTVFWETQSEQNKERIGKQLKLHLEDLAKYYHAQAQKQKKPAIYRQATRWYRLYVDSFPQDPQTPTMNFLLAELLFEARDYLDAASEYEKTAYQYGEHPRRAEAGYASILAYRQYEKTLDARQRKAFHARTIDSEIRFADTFPTHKHTASVLTSAAEDLFKVGKLDRASQIAQRVINVQPPASKELRRTAWTVLAHSQFEHKQYVQAEQSYAQVLHLGSPDSKQYAAIHERMIASVYKQGEQQRDSGNLREGIKHFLRIGALAPQSKIRATAQYDAAASLIQLQDWKRAASVLEDFRRKFPKHPLSKTIPDKLALVYLSSKQHSKAAGELENIARSSKDPTRVKEARWQAAELYEKSGARHQAIQAYINYASQFPQPFERSIEARNKVAELYKRSRNNRKYKEWLQKIVNAEVRGGNQRTARTKYLGVSAAYILAEPQYKAFSKIRLTVPLKRSLKHKKKSMKTVLATYEKIAAYNVSEYTTAATYRIGEIYNQFSKDLMKSQRPKGLKADELEQYEVLLEEQAFPFEEKSIEIHEANANRTVQGIYDKWVKKSFEILQKLKPNHYLKAERSEVSSDALL